MVKADMRKGMLLKGKIGAEERIYRVLDLRCHGGGKQKNSISEI